MCTNCEWENYFSRITEALTEEEFGWATATLEGIVKWVEENEHITDKQILAIENIIKIGERK